MKRKKPPRISAPIAEHERHRPTSTTLTLEPTTLQYLDWLADFENKCEKEVLEDYWAGFSQELSDAEFRAQLTTRASVPSTPKARRASRAISKGLRESLNGYAADLGVARDRLVDEYVAYAWGEACSRTWEKGRRIKRVLIELENSIRQFEENLTVLRKELGPNRLILESDVEALFESDREVLEEELRRYESFLRNAKSLERPLNEIEAEEEELLAGFQL